MPLTPEPIVVLGTFRGGTSCIATAFARLGVHLGAEGDFPPSDEFNPGGYWELEEMQRLGAQVFAGFGMSYFQAEPLPSNWQDRPGTSAMVEDIRALLRKHFSNETHWGWKEPATSVLLPLFREAMRLEGVTSPRYPICVRHPLAVAASQRSRIRKWGQGNAGYSSDPEFERRVEDRTVGLWVCYTLCALQESKGSPRHVVLYEEYLANPKPLLESMVKTLLSWTPSPEQMEEAVASVKPEWSHSRFTDDDFALLPPIVGRTYDLCVRASHDPAGLNAGSFDDEIESLWGLWSSILRMAKPWVMPLAEMYFSHQDRQETKRSYERFSPTGNWQTVKTKIDATPGSWVQVDPYQGPCQIWLRKVAWNIDGRQVPAGLRPGPNGNLENLGALRLTIFGPGSLMVQMPPEGTGELELEFMYTAGEVALMNVVDTAARKLQQVRQNVGVAGGLAV